MKNTTRSLNTLLVPQTPVFTNVTQQSIVSHLLQQNIPQKLLLRQEIFNMLNYCVTCMSPAHLHINILPDYQRKSWRTRLVATAIEFLQDQGVPGGLIRGMKALRNFMRRLDSNLSMLQWMRMRCDLGLRNRVLLLKLEPCSD